MTEGQNGVSEKNECKMSQSMCNSTSTIIAHDVPIKCGQLFGPFTDPLQWLAFKYTDTANSEVIERRTLELFKNIEIARHSDEQNLEIVLRNGQFYFKAMQNITGHANSKLFAWFCDELNCRLPQPSSSTINGSKRYYCGLCNQVFLYPNPVVIHVLFSCTKRHEIIPSNLTTQTVNANRPPVNQTPIPERKKRAFDIASLVNDDKDTKKFKNGFESQSSNNKSAFQPPTSTTISSSSSSTSLTDQTRMASTLISSLPQVSSAFPSNNHIPSAFRKVDKANHLPSNSGDAAASYDSFAAFYGNTRGMGVPSVFAAGAHSGYPTPLSNTLPSLPTSSTAASMPTPATSSSSNKTIIPPSLLPFLPPSLAALSFPQTNWCAKCNATFRMTSDLVYHMRSHHKNQTTTDPLKKKREEKLRCNICGESFRERHHLTRHMTSHQ